MKKIYASMLLAVMLFIGGAVKAQCTDYETLPYSTGFEGTTTLPSCWIRTATGTSGAGTFPSCYEWAPNARNGNVYFEFESTSGAVEIAALPLMQNISSLMLTMWISAQSNYLPTVFEVGVLEDDSVFVPVDTLTLVTSTDWHNGYHEYTVYFANYSGPGERIAMRAHRTSGQYTVMIDDLAVSEFTGCYPVTNITASDLDSASATVSWTDALNTGASYVITYWSGSDTNTEYSSTTTVNLTGLNANSNYTVVVVADCGSGSTGAPATGSFRTTCGTTPIPYTEGFEGLPTGSAPACWTVLSGNPRVMTSYPHTGSQHLYFSGGQPNTIALPPMDQPTSDLQVRFWTRPEGNTYSYCGSFSVGYMTDLNVDSTFVELANWSYSDWAANAYEEKEVPMVGAPDNAYIVLRHNSGATYYYWFVDDVVIEPIPACSHPVSVTVDSVTSSSADISILGTGTDYRVYWSDGYVTDSADVSDSVYTIIGLDASTSYTVAVATICDDYSITSTVSNSFRTLCDADPCTVTINMIDSYGDGWNGAAIYGYSNSALVFQSTFSSGTNGTFSYSHCSTDTLDLRWHSGSYDSETSFEISIAGIQVAAGAGNTYSNNGLIAQSIGCPSCGAPYDVVVNGVTSDGATLTWVAGGGTDFRIYYSDGTTTDSIDVTDSTYTFTNLDASTEYTVTVATICDDNSITSANPVTFHTMCSAGGCQVIFSMTDAFGDGWNGAAITGYVNGANTFQATLSTGSTGSYTYDLCGSDTLALIWSSGNFDDECDFVVTVGGSAFVIGNGDSYSSGDTVGYTIGCPSCPSPTGFTASNITTDSATIVWYAGGSETEWVVTVGDSTFSTTSTTVVLENLNASTSYDVSISAICGGSDTSMALHGSFRTACGLLAIPYTEGFEGLVSETTPPCWTSVNGVAESYNYSAYAHTGSGLLFFGGGMPNTIALPVTAQPTGGLQVRFWTRPEGNTYSSCGSFSVGYMTNLNVDSTFVELANWSYSDWVADVYEEKEVPMVGAPDSARIVFRHNAGATYYYWFVDDVTIEPMPACPRPGILRATSVLHNEIDVEFSGSTSGDYIVYITDGAGYSDSANVTADSTYAFTGLTPLTTYTITIVADCGTEVSPSRSIDVTTTMVADALPINTSFEAGQDTNWMFYNGSQANQWVIGSAAASTGSRSLYISNDNGTSNDYDNGTISNVYVAKLINIDTVGDYSVSFDWRAQAESCCDYLRVFLAPGTAEFTAGQMGSISSTGAPAGWISLDGDNKLNQQSTWVNRTEVFNLSATGNYYLVFFWHNDGSIGSAPAGAIDNVQFSRLSCPQPQNIVVDAVTDATASFHWTPAGSETEWEVTVNGVTTFVNTASASASGLNANTHYNIAVRAVCGVGDTSFATIEPFTTDMCQGAAVVENFDTASASTTSSYSPAGYSFYNYSYVQNIIPASVMGNAGEITAIAFNTASATAGSYFNHMDVYMANVSEDNLSSGFILPDSTHEFVHVIVDRDFSYTTAGWQVHGVDTSFVWDGHSNVLVAFNRGHGSYSSGATFVAHSDSVQRMRYAYNDNAPYNINTVTGGYTSSTVGNIRLISCGAGCPSPVVSTLTYDYGSATVTVTGNNIGYELTYGTDPSNLGNAMTSTDGVFNITGLTPATRYFIAITQQCDSGMVSNPTMRNFVTDSLPCFEPEDLALVGTTFNSAQISWTSNGNATSWIVSITGAGVTRYDTVTTNPYTIANLYADQQYSVMVMSVCGNGAIESGWSEPITFTTDICAKVTGVAVNDITGTTATVSWNPVTGSMGYKVFYGDPDFYDNEALTAEVAAGSTSYTITGLMPQTSYEVYVRNRCTETLYSDVTNADRVGFTTAAGNGIYDVETGTLTLYPNPASEKVTMTVTGFDGAVEVEIVDMNGRVNGKWSVANGQLTIDVSELAQGAYFVRVTGEHQTAVRKLIVK